MSGFNRRSSNRQSAVAFEQFSKEVEMTITARAKGLIQVCLTFAIAVSFAMALPVPSLAEDEVTTIYIVRHAEKDKLKPGEKEPPGPGLTDAGRKRAETLASIMKDAGVKAIYVNDYLRTQKTAEATKRDTGADLFQIKDPVETVKHALEHYRGQTVLIVGRTTTVDDLGHALNVSIPTLRETQYDRMFIVRWKESESDLETREYGERSPD
jgi:phosphohistidine phosphatase SixA